MSMLIIDFETRSKCDLPKAGSYNYAQDESTDILCCSFVPQDPEDDREFLWYPSEGQLPDNIVKLILESELIGAHNAGFDRLIWEYVAVNDYGFPEVDLDDWYCTSAQMRVNNLPASLEDAARALDAKHKKDHRGGQLIRALSIPQKDGTFREDPTLLLEMGEYCLQDGRTTKACVNATRLMTQTEHEDWLNNEDINDRGVKIDRPLAVAAQNYANDEFIDISNELMVATSGVITAHTQSARAAKWVDARLESPEAKALMLKFKDGEPKLTLDKQARANLMDADHNGTIKLPEDVYTVIHLIHEGNQSSVTKFKNMALRADVETDKVQGAFVYAGASQTLRYASRGLQMHNMPSRNLYKTIDEAWQTYDLMLAGARIESPVMQTLKKMLRHAVMPNDGELLVIGDWTGIEARVLPWLSDSIGGDKKLDLIETGADIYTLAAEAIGSDNRAVGKVMELACFAADTKVITDNGIKSIVDVTLSDKLWDGISWVAHEGVIWKGQQKTINLDGVEVTAEHLIRTGKTWKQAKELASNKNILARALATGSESLPYLALKGLGLKTLTITKCASSALAEQTLTLQTRITYVEAQLHDAMLALKHKLIKHEKVTGAMPIYAPTPMYEDGCLTVSRQRTHAATAQAMHNTKTMGVEVSRFFGRKVLKGVEVFLKPLSLLMATTLQSLKWIESTAIEVTSQITYDLSQKQLTTETDGALPNCKTKSNALKHVYDIMNVGSKNRFTVVSKTGCLIVHNCGYEGGVNAFKVFAKSYGVSLPEHEIKRAIKRWREANAWVVEFWRDLEKAAIKAMQNPRQIFTAGMIKYMFEPTLIEGTLICFLPDDSILQYPKAKLERTEYGLSITTLKASVKMKADADEWPRESLYGGRLAGHCSQGTAAALLRNLIGRVDKVIAHVHDELILSVPEDEAEEHLLTLEDAMGFVPDWAEGLPLDAKCEISERYKK